MWGVRTQHFAQPYVPDTAVFDVFVPVTGAVAELRMDRTDAHPSPLLQRTDGDVPASGELVRIEDAWLVGDGLRCVALLHDVFPDRLRL